MISSQGDAATAVPDPIRPDMVAGYRDHLDVVTAELVGDHPDWATFGALLIRPDGYVACSFHRDTTAPIAPALAAWLVAGSC